MSVDWRNLPSLSSLRAFEATAAEGSFAGAARVLNVTHAAVAQQVRGLERRLGVRLALRSGRSVALTQEGERLAKALTTGFTQVEKGVAELIESEAQRGLRITTTQFLGAEIIMPNLAAFWERHPGVEIAIYPSRAFVDIVSEGFDCGIRVAQPGDKPEWPGLDSIFLFRTQMIAVGSHELVGDGSKDPQNLPWLHHDEMESKLRTMRLCGIDTEDLTYVRIGSGQVQLQALKQGLGLTMFSEHIGKQYIHDGILAVQPLPKETYLDYNAVVPKGPRNPLVGDFIDWVRSLVE